VFDLSDASVVRTVGVFGTGPRQFNLPFQVWVASDGFVFVAGGRNARVEVLTPELTFHCSVGEGQLMFVASVCANADVVVVSDRGCPGVSGTVPDARLSVFRRSDGALMRRIGWSRDRRGHSKLGCVEGVCFMHSDRHIDVVDSLKHRVSVFTLHGGVLERHIGASVLRNPEGVACSACDELIVADSTACRAFVFSDVGDLMFSFGTARVFGVTIHGGRVITQEDHKFVVWC
jgi:hypothetical protein